MQDIASFICQDYPLPFHLELVYKSADIEATPGFSMCKEPHSMCKEPHSLATTDSAPAYINIS